MASGTLTQEVYRSMANPKSPGAGDELSPEQQKFKEVKQQQSTSDAAGGSEFRSDSGEYLKSGRQQKEEVKTAKKAATPKGPPVSRREFLNYAWGAALGVVVIEAGLASLFFALPRFKAGEFGGIFPVGTGSSMPPPDAPPVAQSGRPVLAEQRHRWRARPLAGVHPPRMSIRVEGPDFPLRMPLPRLQVS